MLIILAMYDENRRISFSKNNPNSFINDPSFFKEETEGKNILFDEATQKMIGTPLPNRRTFIISEKIYTKMKGVEIYYNRSEIIKRFAKKSKEDIYICGGQIAYKMFVNYSDKIIVFHNKNPFKTTTFFPVWNVYDYSNKTVMDENKEYTKILYSK